MPISGSQRHEKLRRISEADIVVTSYALLRRDIDHYETHKFAAAVLDEVLGLGAWAAGHAIVVANLLLLMKKMRMN